jgi:protein SCO1/2
MTLKKIVLGSAALLALAGGIGWAIAVWRDNSAPPTVTTASAGQALVTSDFELVDHRGHAARDEDFRGLWQLVFFGFTYCPDVCPTGLATISTVLDELGPAADKIVPLFITVDPERDRPEVLKDYLANFHPKILGLTGTTEQVAAATKGFRVYFRKVQQPDQPDAYTLDHSTFIYLMDPEGGYATHMSPQLAPEEIAARLREKIAAHDQRT